MPTIIDELAMTLKLDPAGFEEGADKAETASDSLLARIMASLQKIERATAATAASTTRVHETAATAAGEAANKAADAQGAAAKRGANEQEEAGKKAAEAAHKHADEIKESFDRSAESVKHVAEELLALFGISLSVEAMKRLFETIQDGDEKSGNLAKSIGLNVEALTEWQNAAGRLGGTSEGVTSAMETLSNERQAFHYTGKSNLPAQARELFGADIIGPDGEMLQGPELTMALAKAAKAKGMTPEQITYATRQMNIAGLAAPITAGPEAIQKELDFQKKSGNYTTDEDYKRALELSDALSKVQNSAMGVARVFWRELGPAITGIVERIENWIDLNREWLNEKATEWGRRLGDFLKDLAKDFDLLINGGAGKFATTIGEVAYVANETAKAVGGWQVVMEGFVGFWLANKVFTAIKTIQMMTSAITGLGGSGMGLPALLGRLNPVIAVLLGAYTLLHDILPAVVGDIPLARPPTPDGEGQSTPNAAGRGAEGGRGRTEREPSRGTTGRGGGGRPGGAEGGGVSRTAEPVAPGATGSLTEAVGITPAQYGAFRASVAKIENARYDQMGGSSMRFAGKFQMGADEIRETAQHLGVPPPTREQFLADPGMQEKFFEQYTLDHHKYLMAHNEKYRAMSPEDRAAALGYAHNQGAGGASKWINTGMEGRDANGTSGAAYSNAIHHAFNAQPATTPATQVAAAATAPAPATAAAAPTPAAPAFNFSGTGGNPFMPSMVPSPAAVDKVAPTPAPATPAPQVISMNMGGGEPVGAATGARDYSMNTNNSTIDRSQSSETHVGDVHIHTAATDPRGVAVAFNEGVVKKYDYSRLADNGLA